MARGTPLRTAAEIAQERYLAKPSRKERISQPRLPGAKWGGVKGIGAIPETPQEPQQLRIDFGAGAPQARTRQPRLALNPRLSQDPTAQKVDWKTVRGRVYGDQSPPAGAPAPGTKPPDENNRLINRQVQPGQFNRENVKEAAKSMVDLYTMGRYFRHVGVSGAIRHVLGMPQVPSHVNDHINARRNQVQHGHQPKPIYAVQQMEAHLGKEFRKTMDE